MNYVYDILLNFTTSKRVYDFFEWESNDTILNVKKAPIFRVSKEVLWDIFHYRLKFSQEFLKKIENSASVYKQNKKTFQYLAVFSDGNRAIGFNLNQNGITEYKSSLLIDEEEEVCFIGMKLNEENVSYKKLDKEERDSFITRKETEEKDYLVKEFKNLYKNNDVEKLKYLYIEYFNKKEDQIDTIYHSLLNSLEEMDERHDVLYNLLKLTCKK